MFWPKGLEYFGIAEHSFQWRTDGRRYLLQQLDSEIVNNSN